jgi:hypothetical protein
MAGGPIKRGSLTPLLDVDLRKVYVETGKERPLEYPQFFNLDEMDRNPVRDLQISGLGQMPTKPEGTQFGLDEPILGGEKEYLAEPFGLAVEITWEMWRDEQYGVMRELVAELARASRNRQELDAWGVLEDAFDDTVTGFAGSESLCDTAHVGLDGATRANRPSPDIGFSALGIQNAILRFEDMTDERGMPRLLAPTMCLISARNKFAAREILGSAAKPYTADNELNALVSEDLSWMVMHYLTNKTAWFLSAAKGIHDLNFLWRDHPIFDSFDDPWTKNGVWTVYQRHTKGFGTWRGVDGSTG